jgi:hypothetical protein
MLWFFRLQTGLPSRYLAVLFCAPLLNAALLAVLWPRAFFHILRFHPGEIQAIFQLQAQAVVLSGAASLAASSLALFDV